MKKIGVIFLMLLFIALNLGMANSPAAMNHNSVPLSSQEMDAIVGGDDSILACGYIDEWACCCLNLWIFQICGCVINPLALL
jgi:hypothetical protein